MKIVIIGANGFVGSKLVIEALNRGHTVSLVSKHRAKENVVHPSATFYAADVLDVKGLAEILKGHDAVLSAFNPGWHHPEIYTEFLLGSLSIQKAVKTAGVARILVVGGAGSLEISPGKQLVDAADFPEEWKAGALAARDYLTILSREQHLDWTYLSPAVNMHPGTSGVRTGQYRTGFNTPVFNKSGESKISVEDVAVALLDETERPRFVKQRYTIAW
jgi:putative NADH-flavin reductase